MMIPTKKADILMAGPKVLGYLLWCFYGWIWDTKNWFRAAKEWIWE